MKEPRQSNSIVATGLPGRFQMHMRMSIISTCALVLVVVATLAYGIGHRDSAAPAVAAQEASSTWNSTMVWRPTLEEAGIGLAEVVNRIDASCSVDVDPVVPTDGTGPEGTVCAFAVTWAC
jgi:hypothetical protein